MMGLRSRIVAVGLSLLAVACADRVTLQEDVSGSEIGSETAAMAETTRIEGWWEVGDSSGPYVAELYGDDIIAIDRDLSHGEYGRTADRFEFESESGRLARYHQESDLRLMDPDAPSRLVPFVMELDFDESGSLGEGEKMIDGIAQEVESADVDRVLAQVERLIELTRSFARVYAEGGEPVQFLCPDDTTFMVTFSGDAVVLDLGRSYGRHVLSQQRSASGAKFGNELYVFWNKGDEAMVELFGEPLKKGCREQE